MQVKEIMTREVEVIHPNNTLEEAAKKMKDLDIGPLPVCEDKRVLGMLTDRDITVRATADGQDPWTSKVNEVMSPQITYCFEDQDVTEAARLMKEKQVRRLLVLDRGKRLAGIVSLGDLAVEARNEQLVGEALEGISEPSSPQR